MFFFFWGDLEAVLLSFNVNSCLLQLMVATVPLCSTE